MSRSHIFLVVIFILLGMTVLIVEKPFSEPEKVTIPELGILYPDFDSAQIAKMTFGSFGGATELVKKNDEWFVVDQQKEFPADMEAIQKVFDSIKEMKKLLCFITFLLLSISVSCTSDTQDRTVSEQVLETDKQFLLTYPNLENPGGEILLENEHIVLQRLVVGPGEWEGIHSHPGNQIYVHIKGGECSGRAGGESTYDGSIDEDGAVGWMEARKPDRSASAPGSSAPPLKRTANQK